MVTVVVGVAAACKFAWVFLWLRLGLGLWLFCMYSSRSFGKLFACVAHNFRARHKFAHTRTRTYSYKSRIYGAAKELFLVSGDWRGECITRTRYVHSFPHSHAPPRSYQFIFRSIDHTATQTHSCTHFTY